MREYTVIFCPYGETGSPIIDYANAATPDLAELAVLEKALRVVKRVQRHNPRSIMAYAALNIPCPFLSRQGEYRGYTARPGVCRSHLSPESCFCKQGIVNGPSQAVYHNIEIDAIRRHFDAPEIGMLLPFAIVHLIENGFDITPPKDKALMDEFTYSELALEAANGYRKLCTEAALVALGS